MKKMALYLGIILLALLAVIFIAGSLMPATRSFTHHYRFSSPVENVFQTVTDVKGQENWRSDLKEIRMESSATGEESWLEVPHRQPPIRFRSTLKVPNERYELALEGQGFQGKWTGVFRAAETGGTEVSFTETATVPSPFSRVLAFFLVDVEKTMALYYQDLKRQLGE